MEGSLTGYSCGAAFPPRAIDIEHRDDGSVVLRSRLTLPPYEVHVPAYLRHWAAVRPDRAWLARREGPGLPWRTLTYGDALSRVDALTEALLGIAPGGGPLMILSGNSIEHALVMMAGMQAGMPVAPVSPAYSLMSRDHAKLRYIFDLVRPSVVFVQDGEEYASALAALDLAGVPVIHVGRPAAMAASYDYATLARTVPTDAVGRALAALTPETIGKILFTSGSTGRPKAVINTQRMMCANLAMMEACRPSDPERVAVTMSWMPWNHTMGGNAILQRILAQGGTFYLDDGKPVPGAFEETLRNLREVSLTYYSNVPAAYAMLTAALEHDPALCRSFFRDLESLAYGGAAMSNDLYERLQRLAVATTGKRVFFTTSWGSTELAPCATSIYWETERLGLMGLPMPGVELKMLPFGDKYELRVRGPSLMPGYYNQPQQTAEAFDEEGFYRIGDCAVFADPADPLEGLVFAGRVVEDFKLDTGTFVHVGPLRTAAIAAASPVIQDAVVTGQDRPYVGLLAWPNLHACRQVAGASEAAVETLAGHPAVLARLRDGLRAHAAQNPGSSTRVRRVILLTEPPSIDGNELTDKGYINQRATLARRAGLVEQLYAEPPGPEVIVID